MVVALQPYRLVRELAIGPASSLRAERRAPMKAHWPLLQRRSASIDSKKTPKQELSSAASM